MILGDIEHRQGNFPAAVEAYAAIEQQNHVYLSMVGEKLYEAYAAQGKPEEGLNRLTGYMQTFPELDLINVVYEKSLLLKGEKEAAQTAVELVRRKPDLNGVYRLLGLKLQRFGCGLESRCRHDAFGYRTAAPAQRDVPLPQLPLQIPSLFLALSRLQQMADVYAE